MDLQQILFLVILFVAVVLFIGEWIRIDMVSIGIVLALAISGILDVKEAFAGFASEPAIIVAAVFVLSGALTRTGFTDHIGKMLGKLSGQSETWANLVIMTGVAAMSAFTHHLMITAMMLPIVVGLCKEKGFSPSRMLIPMATAASLGTILTIIGAPAFLLAKQILKRSGEVELGLFSIAKVGLPIVAASFLFIALLRWILPKNSAADGDDERFKISNISTELVIAEVSPWIGKTIGEFKEASDKRFRVLSMFRDHRSLAEEKGQQILRAGDVLLVETSSDELISVDEKLGLALKTVKQYASRVQTETVEGDKEKKVSLTDQDNRLVQAIIEPRSQFAGKSLAQMRFVDRFGVVAVGIWRKKGWIREEISDIVLREGDLVVFWGPEERIDELARESGFLMMLPLAAKPKRRAKMPLAVTIMAGSIVAAATGWLPAHVAFVLGAFLMVLTHCITVERAYQSIETRVFVLIAGVIPLGLAMEKVGVDKMAADLVLEATQGLSPFWMMMVFFWASALLTQILSDAATTVILAPIALAFAHSAQISPVAAVITVTVGAVASFLTPIGHHGNLLILNPGGYRFADFLKIGLPLTVLISVMTAYLSLRTWT